MQTRKTFCRFCHANCAIEVDIDDGRAVTVCGDTSDVCRRTRQYFNSTGQDLERLRVKGVTNYAHMHPADLRALAIEDEAVVEISTPHARVLGIAKASADLKPGVISMAHAFGAQGDDAGSVRAHGASTNRLVNDEIAYDPITGQCRQSAIPVRVRPA